MMTRLLLTILLGTIGIRAVMAAGSSPGQRSGSQLCSELTREVNISAQRGLLTQSEANKISERCYRLYGGKSDV